MGFRTNEGQQLTLDDRRLRLTEREQNILENSWAASFSKAIFYNINESRFSVLYDTTNGRPNTPINVIIGALILKDIFGLTDEEVTEAVLFDVRFQHALSLTSFVEIPFSDRTFSRFRERLYKYELETGIDLLKDEVKELASSFMKFANIKPDLYRMDSLMIDSNCKDMGRLELVCTVTQNLVKAYVENEGEKSLPDKLKIYLEQDNKNSICYHMKDVDVKIRLESLIADAFAIYTLCGDAYVDNVDYKLMARLLGEQTKMLNGETVVKENKEIESTSLQNPSDPDATHRHKAGENYTGYVGNIVEACGDNGNIVTDFDFQQNIHSDVEFGKDAIDSLGEQDEEIPLVADGGFASKGNFELAEENNIKLVATNLTGKKVDETVADYEIDEDKNIITRCPAGETPIKSEYNEEKDLYTAYFDIDKCKECPLKDRCQIDIKKKVAVVRINKTTIERAEYSIKLTTEEYKGLARKRNGVEGVMSELRRRYGMNDIPVMGFLRTKMWFTMKIGSMNARRIIKILKNNNNAVIA